MELELRRDLVLCIALRNDTGHPSRFPFDFLFPNPHFPLPISCFPCPVSRFPFPLPSRDCACDAEPTLTLPPASSPEDIVARLTSELRLTTAYLQIHPKVYWIWNHRKWCLENVPLGPAPGAAEASAGSAEGAEQAESSGAGVTSEASASASVSASASASTSHPKTGREGWRNEFWKMELGLIEKMLDADARNCEWVAGPGMGGRAEKRRGGEAGRGLRLKCGDSCVPGKVLGVVALSRGPCGGRERMVRAYHAAWPAPSIGLRLPISCTDVLGRQAVRSGVACRSGLPPCLPLVYPGARGQRSSS